MHVSSFHPIKHHVLSSISFWLWLEYTTETTTTTTITTIERWMEETSGKKTWKICLRSWNVTAMKRTGIWRSVSDSDSRSMKLLDLNPLQWCGDLGNPLQKRKPLVERLERVAKRRLREVQVSRERQPAIRKICLNVAGSVTAHQPMTFALRIGTRNYAKDVSDACMMDYLTKHLTCAGVASENGVNEAMVYASASRWTLHSRLWMLKVTSRTSELISSQFELILLSI